MPVLEIPASHICIDDKGREWIDETTYRVEQVVMDHIAHGWSPEEISFQHYGALSLAQVHAALAYYYDHQEAMDARMKQNLVEYENMRASAEESPFRKRMRAEGKLA
ncbi:MAG: DUF433 domain-containing protein [Candidatus Sumerlaeota bacterium]|nr:DUF433 domain-containing protein [Candidatus Sumerlaeota bacterium]